MKKMHYVIIFLILIFSAISLIEISILNKKNIIISELNTSIANKDKEIKLLKEKNDSSIENVNPIDKAESDCMNIDYSTIGMLNCTQTAIDSWNNQIAKDINLLKEILDENDNNLLVTSQQDWEKYNKSTNDFIKSLIIKKQGTMYVNVSSGLIREIVKQRALNLREYINITND